MAALQAMPWSTSSTSRGRGATRRGGRREPVKHLADKLPGGDAASEHGLRADDHGGAAEWLDPHSRPLERGGVFLHEFEFVGGEFEPFGYEQRLHLEPACRHRGLELFVQDPFVERVLVDHLDPRGCLDDDVAVVHLHRQAVEISRSGVGVGFPGGPRPSRWRSG